MAAVQYKRVFEVLSRERADAVERRRHRRVAVALTGRMLDAAGRELSCRTQDVSAGGARVIVLGRAARGDSVVHFDGLGRVEAAVVWANAGEIALRFDAGLAKRERIVEELTWRLNERALGLVAERPARVAADHALAAALLDTGESLLVRAVDVSLAGATLECAETAPPIGAWIRIGMTWGRVARIVPGGFAVDFEPKGRPARG